MTRSDFIAGAVQNQQINLLYSELVGKIRNTTAMQNLSDVTTMATKVVVNPTGPLSNSSPSRILNCTMSVAVKMA